MVRILDVPPYNQFLLSCSVWAEALGERVPLPLSIDWIKRVEIRTRSTPTLRFTAIVSKEPHLAPDPADGYQSILVGSETNYEGSTSYRCRAAFLRDSGGANVQKTNDSLIAVVGMSPHTHNFCVGQVGARKVVCCVKGLKSLLFLLVQDQLLQWCQCQ